MTSNHPNMGRLALQPAVAYPLMALRSNAGWYVGTFCPEDGPLSRESVEYFPSKEATERAIQSGSWSPRRAH